MNNNEIEEKLKKAAENDDIQVPKTFHSRIEEILATLPEKEQIKTKTKKLSLMKYAITASVAVTLLVFGIGQINHQNQGTQNGTQKSAPNAIKGSPMVGHGFKNPIKILSNSEPLHANQTFEIEPSDTNWKGKNVKIYYVPIKEVQELIVNKNLPSDAQYLGITSINEGKWSYKMQVPKDGESFLIAAVSDSGILSGYEVQTLNYGTIDFSSYDVTPGQTITFSGSGFSKAIKISIDFTDKNIRNGIPIGSTRITNGAFSTNITIPSQINDKPVTKGNHQVLVYAEYPNGYSDFISMNLTIN